MLSDEFVESLKQILPADSIKTDAESCKTYATDWTKALDAKAGIVLFPKTTEHVSKIMSLCHKTKTQVVPSGGRTGLAGGCVALQGEVVLSFDKMNSILSVNKEDMSAEVEAGVTTQALQDAAKAAGLFFSLDLAAKGSSHIGGNIATNAGGLKLIKYGGAREQVLGLEVVLADGTVLDLNTSLRKNNTGVDLKHLFIGSEGTLGIITKATVKLSPPPKALELVCLATESFENIPKLLSKCFQKGVTPTAFEFFTSECLEIVLKHHPNCQNPFSGEYKYYILLECEGQGGNGPSVVENIIEFAFEGGLAEDGVLASSSQQFQNLWSLRENISESLSIYKYLYKNDISVAVGDLAETVDSIANISQSDDRLKLYLFGHIGDGNLHINYASDDFENRDEFLLVKNQVEEKILQVLKEKSGSISAEHGIGLLKKEILNISCSKEEIDLMISVKSCLDPLNILNPGKILPG